MLEIAFYTLIVFNIAVLGLSLIAIARVGKITSSTNELDWSAVANITGDLATLKKTVQTLNNRLNGMNKAAIDEDVIRLQMAQLQEVPTRQTGG